MELLTPGIGLIFWQLVVFLLVFTVLAVFVWKPISDALKARNSMIEDSLKAAENAKEEMENMKADNEYLLQEAKMEREKIITDANAAANRIKEEAKANTQKIADQMIADAKSTIEGEKRKALTEVKSLVSELSLEIAEKVLREKLKDDKSQKELVEKFLGEVKIN